MRIILKCALSSKKTSRSILYLFSCSCNGQLSVMIIRLLLYLKYISIPKTATNSGRFLNSTTWVVIRVEWTRRHPAP